MTDTITLSRSMHKALKVLGENQDANVRYSNMTIDARPPNDACVYWQAADQLIDAGLATSRHVEGVHVVTLTYSGRRRFELEFIG